MLLRRVPWRCWCGRAPRPSCAHVRLLAEQRGVPVHEVDELTYSCVGLIHPRYTRGATGADGTAVARDRARRVRPRPHAHLLRGCGRRATAPDAGDLVAVERYEGRRRVVDDRGRRARVRRRCPRRAVVLPVTTRTPGAVAAHPAARPAAALRGHRQRRHPARRRRRRPALGRGGRRRSSARVAPLAEVWRPRRAGVPAGVDAHAAQRRGPVLLRGARARPDAGRASWPRPRPGPTARGWQLSLQGRKLYWVPRALTKSAAVAEVARRVGADVDLRRRRLAARRRPARRGRPRHRRPPRRAGRQRLARAARRRHRRARASGPARRSSTGSRPPVGGRPVARGQRLRRRRCAASTTTSATATGARTGTTRLAIAGPADCSRSMGSTSR